METNRQAPIRIMGVWVVVVVAAFLGCKRSKVSREKQTNLAAGLEDLAKEVLPWVENGITVHLVSPDVRQLLTKTETKGGDFELRLEDIETRQLLGRYEGGAPFLIAWRPKSGVISFVKDNQGDRKFRLHLWTPESGQVVVPDVPVIAADRFTRWSPDGRYLSFRIAGEGGEPDQLRLFDASTLTCEPSAVFEANALLDFRWSPEGDRLAVVAAGGEGNVAIVDMLARRRRNVLVSPGAEFKHLAWMPDGRQIVVACREKGQASFVLKEVDLESGKSRILSSPDGDVSNPVPLQDGRILYLVDKGRTERLMIKSPEAVERALGAVEGRIESMVVDARRGDVVVDYTGLARPRGLHRISLADGSDKLIMQQGFSADFQGVAPVRTFIPNGGGGKIPLFVWRAGPRPSKGVVIRFPHGPDDNRPVSFYGENQYIIHQGYDYIMFNLSQNDAGGALSDPANYGVADALAVVNYARRVLEAPPNKIVLFGESAATALVTQTAARMQEKRGGILLRGMVWLAQTSDDFSGHHFRIASLHGENDAFRPAEAKALIEDIFGPAALSDPNGLWRVLENEGHTPRLARSRALITAAIIRMLTASE